jgi:hypothetical protein
MSIVAFRGRFYNTILFSLFLFVSFSSAFGQPVRQQAPPLRERLFFGGNLGLQFGTITNINVSPVIGLWVLPRIAVAAGPEYTYYKDPYYSTDIFGGKVYSEFVLIQDLNNILPVGIHMGLFFHAEYESLSLESAVWNPNLPSTRFQINTTLIGGGISQQLGRRSSMNFILLWVVNDSGYSYYSNPEVRISFNF